MKFPAVVTNVASNAGGGVMSPQSRGEDAHMLASERRKHAKKMVAAAAWLNADEREQQGMMQSMMVGELRVLQM